MTFGVVRRTRRAWWTLTRLGWTPAKLLSRYRGPRCRGALVISVPKSGTHLIERAFCLLPAVHRRFIPTVNDRNADRWGGAETLIASIGSSELMVSHLTYSEARRDAVALTRASAFFMIRDPRDVVVSQVFHLERFRRHPMYSHYIRRRTFKERLLLAIDGSPAEGIPSFGDRLRRFQGWLEGPCHLVRFEDLVGPEGGGDPERQVGALEGVYGHLGVHDAPRAAREIAAKLFSSSSPTFRRGSVQQWTEYFDDEIAESFEQAAGWTLGALGYTSTRA